MSQWTKGQYYEASAKAGSMARRYLDLSLAWVWATVVSYELDARVSMWVAVGVCVTCVVWFVGSFLAGVKLWTRAEKAPTWADGIMGQRDESEGE